MFSLKSKVVLSHALASLLLVSGPAAIAAPATETPIEAPLVPDTSAPVEAPLKVGDVVFETQFDKPDDIKAWQFGARAKVEKGYKDSLSLRIERAATLPKGTIQVRTALPVEKLRGARLKFEAMVKAENVAEPEKAYNGVKVLLDFTTPAGHRYGQAGNAAGTFDWKLMQGTFLVPRDATEGYFLLGLQETTGVVWFDDVKVTVEALPQ